MISWVLGFCSNSEDLAIYRQILEFMNVLPCAWPLHHPIQFLQPQVPASQYLLYAELVLKTRRLPGSCGQPLVFNTIQSLGESRSVCTGEVKKYFEVTEQVL